MKKTTVLVVAVLLISINFLCGCNEQQSTDTNNVLSDEEKFIGSWNLWNPSEIYDTNLTFNTNETIKDETYDDDTDTTEIKWSSYEVKNNEICSKFHFLIQIPPTDEIECYSYQFSTDNQEIAVSDSLGNEIFKLIKI